MDEEDARGHLRVSLDKSISVEISGMIQYYLFHCFCEAWKTWVIVRCSLAGCLECWAGTWHWFSCSPVSAESQQPAAAELFLEQLYFLHRAAILPCVEDVIACPTADRFFHPPILLQHVCQRNWVFLCWALREREPHLSSLLRSRRGPHPVPSGEIFLRWSTALRSSLLYVEAR